MKVQMWCIVLAGSLVAIPAFGKSAEEPPSKNKVKQLEQAPQEVKVQPAAPEKDTLCPANHSDNKRNRAHPDAQRSDCPKDRKPESAKKEVATLVMHDAPAKTDDGAGGGQQPKEEKKPRLDIYGFAMLDLGYDNGQNDPAWFDVVRPTKLPSFPNEFGRDGRFYAGVRQSRFGVKGFLPTDWGEVKTIFEFEMFGVGVDAGQTTIRLRHAWGELGEFGAGQSWSPFMDPDVFPNSVEYWGPNGMVFFRNVQLRWMPINNGNKQLWFAIERPGASADAGVLSERIELQGLTGRFPAPDLSARLRWGGERGHVQLSGIGRYIAWDDANRSAVLDLSGHTWGWGVNLSSNLPVAKKDVVKLSVMYGEGVENYMNDAPVDVAPVLTGNPRTPIDGEPLPVFGLVAFYDRYWSEEWSSSIGYSMVDIDNTPLQTPDAFRRGHYALANLLYYPAKNVMTGLELQWGRRENNTDGFTFDDYRIQLSARYNFDFTIGGKK